MREAQPTTVCHLRDLCVLCYMWTDAVCVQWGTAEADQCGLTECVSITIDAHVG